MSDDGFDLEDAIGRLEQEFRLRDSHRTGIVPRSEFSFALVRNGGMLDQIDALAQQFGSKTVPGAVNYVAFMQHMKELAKLATKEEEPNLLPSPPPAVDCRPRALAEVPTHQEQQLRDFVPSPEFFERVSGVAAEVARRSASPPQVDPLMMAQTPSPPPAPLRVPPPQPAIAQQVHQVQHPVREVAAPRHVDAVNMSHNTSAATSAGTKAISLRTVFAVVDEDGDGRVSSEDVGIAFALHGIRTPQEQIDALFDAFEEPTVNYTNFCTLVSRLPPDTIASIRSAANWSTTLTPQRSNGDVPRRQADATPPSRSPAPAVTTSIVAPAAKQHAAGPVELVRTKPSGPDVVEKRLRFERPTQSSNAKQHAATGAVQPFSAALREPFPSKAQVPASPAASKKPPPKRQPAGPDVHKISLVQKLAPPPAAYPQGIDLKNHADMLMAVDIKPRNATVGVAPLSPPQPIVAPPMVPEASPAFAIDARTAAKFNGNASQLLHLCTNMDRRQCGELEIPRMQIALRAVAPSLSSSEVALLCEMSLTSSSMTTCNYVKLAGDLIMAEAELRERTTSPHCVRSPEQFHSEPPQPQPTAALAARSANLSKSKPAFIPPAASTDKEPPRSRSRSQSNTSVPDDGNMTLEERVRRGREKMRLLIKQELLAAAQDDVHMLLEFLAQDDPSQSGYLDEKVFRRTLVALFKAGDRQLSPWVMDRCVKTSRLPFEASHAPTAEMSQTERHARHTAQRCPAKLQGSMCDYRFLLADLGLVEY